MPVSIDTVYQRVLAISNKEQRGYITPIEFNLLANQAQLEIFEQYFYDLDQFKRKQDIPGQETDLTSFSDSIELISKKLSVFTNVIALLGGSTTYPTILPGPIPVYSTGRIFAHGVVCKKITLNELDNLLNSNFHRDALVRSPVYIESNVAGEDIRVWDGVQTLAGRMTTGVTCEVITEPTAVRWGYDIIGEKALYNASTSINFTLHDSEETELVFKVLGLAGVVMNKPGLTSIAMAKESGKIQQEKI